MSPDRERIEAHIRYLRAELSHLDRYFDRAIRDWGVWRKKQEPLRSVPRVGPWVSAAILARLPELVAVDDKKLAALVGVVPLNRDSGIFCGRRAVTVARYKPVFQAFHGPLLALDYAVNGKSIGPEGVKRRLGWLRATFGDRSLTVEDLVVEGDKVVMRWALRGEHTGELMEVVPTGRTVVLREINVYRQVGGRIMEIYEVVDI